MGHQKRSLNEQVSKLWKEKRKCEAQMGKEADLQLGVHRVAKKAVSKFRLQCLRFSVPETKTTCFSVKKN